MTPRRRLLASLAAGLAIALLAWTASPAHAAEPHETYRVCPIGGETFPHVSPRSYTTWGQRPDGKPYGDWTFPVAPPVCPGTGLVMFRTFTPAELRALAPLVASDEYRAMIGRDTLHYRAAWLAGKLDPRGYERLWLLSSAGWEVDGDPALRARYQRELVEGVAALPFHKLRLDWFQLQARAINARRELGEFEDATDRLRALPMASLRYARGERAPETRAALWTYLAQLEAVIARKDASAEPFDMVPLEEAVRRCLDAADAPAAMCEREAVKAEVEIRRGVREEIED